MAIQSLAQLRNKISGRPDIDSEEDQEHPLINALSKIPGYAIDSALSLPGNIADFAMNIPGTIHKIGNDKKGAAQDILGSIARGSQRTASSALEAGEYLTRKGAEAIGKSLGHPVNVPKWNAREFMGLEGERPIDLGKMIESKNPDPLLSGVYNILGASSLGAKIPSIIGASAMTGALQANPGQRIQGATEGTVTAGLPIGAGKLAVKGFNAARPSNLLRGTLSPEELQANLKASEGTNTGLGNVIGSPTLKRVQENILPNMPFSGAYTAMQKTAQQVTQKGEDLMAKIGENLPEGDKTQILQTAIKKAAREAAQEKNVNYKKVNDIADEIGLRIERSNFKSKANEILRKINSSPDLKRELDPGFIADIQHYARPETQRMGIDALVKPIDQNLSTSNILKGKLNDKANDYYANSQNYEHGLMKDLRDALGEDIESSINSSKNDKLKSAYETAQKEYGTKFAPFENPDITKFTREGGDPDLMLSHFLRTGVNDRGELIGRLTKKLPKDLRNLPLYMYLSRAIEDGQLNPTKFNTLYGKLGEKQLKSLIPDKTMRKEIENYTRGVGMNKEAFQTMFNPKTGQRNLDSMVGTMEALAGYSLGGLKGAAVALPVGGIAGRLANKLLTSEKVRTSLIKKMLKAKK